MGQQRSLWIELKGGLSGSDMRPRGLSEGGWAGRRFKHTHPFACCATQVGPTEKARLKMMVTFFFLTFKTDVKFLQRSRRQKKKS